MNKRKLFDLVGLSIDPEPISQPQEPEYNIDFIKIKMFTKLIESRKEFKKNINKNQNLEVSEDLIDNIIFNRALFYIETLEVDKLNKIEELKSEYKKRFVQTIQQSIKHFEQLEQYENCAFLFNIEKEISSIRKSTEEVA